MPDFEHAVWPVVSSRETVCLSPRPAVPTSTNHPAVEPHASFQAGSISTESFSLPYSQVIPNNISTPRTPCSNLPLLASIPHSLSFIPQQYPSSLLAVVFLLAPPLNSSHLTSAHTLTSLPMPRSAPKHSISMVYTPQLQEDSVQTSHHPFFTCSKQQSGHTEGRINTQGKDPQFPSYFRSEFEQQTSGSKGDSSVMHFFGGSSSSGLCFAGTEHTLLKALRTSWGEAAVGARV